MTSPHLLLLSSSRYRDAGFLVDGLPVIKDFLVNCIAGDIKDVLFVPYANAAKEYDDYEARVAAIFDTCGLGVQSIHHESDPVAAVRSAQAIAIGGGNTFALLSRLQEAKLIEPIRQAVMAGTPYIGWSAGSNMACPTLCTTNDMPICEPESFDALALIPFQINPHFVSGQIAGHNGESREQRLAEFMAVSPHKPVLALPEGTALRRHGEALTMSGHADGILFSADKQQVIKRDEDVSWMLSNLQTPDA
ncbi:MAG: dipeptidase PepE [Alphaproteobacteria bacterium]|jgi:dipeptidase E|nr:dipeptidase PepE [Alphaproteobacteria bacterium]MBT4016380.1 dipeptidase PepE [Alphaproteobacteria bacterium]